MIDNLKVSPETIDTYQKMGKMIIPVKYPKLGTNEKAYVVEVAEALSQFICSPVENELKKTGHGWWNTWDMPYKAYREMVNDWPLVKQFTRPLPVTNLEDRILCSFGFGAAVIIDEEDELIYLTTDIPRRIGGNYWDKGMGYFAIRGVFINNGHPAHVAKISQVDFLLGDCEENTYAIRTQWKWLNEKINEIASHAAEAHGE